MSGIRSHRHKSDGPADSRPGRGQGETSMKHFPSSYGTWTKGASLALALAIFSVPGAAHADPAAEDTLFTELPSLDVTELAGNSGGANTISLGDLGLNIASNNADVTGNSVEGNVTTGQIGNNSLEDVSGINSLMFNTGNNVNFQSNMQINIFLK